ncbi:hypothetical protein MTO96_003818 [Rhipicephalus appendiculatus]
MLLRLFSTCLLFCSASTLQDGEIVYPTLLTPRSNKGRKVLLISQNITLYLEKSQVFSNDFIFTTESNDEKILYRMKREYYEKNLYHDEQSMASVIVDEDNGVQVEGILSDTMRIRPMTQMERSEDGRIPHIIYEVKLPLWTKEDPRRYRKIHQEPLIPVEERQEKPQEGRRKHRREILPEIHVVVDCAFAYEFRFSELAVTLYVAVYFNAVNLRFGTIRRPRIRLRVVGITMWNTKPPYLAPGKEKDQVLDIETLKAFNDYYRGKIQFNNSDLMFLLTGLDMVFIEKNVTRTWVGGYANIGAICQENKVAMAEDRPRAFINVQTVAHEIGHSLGCAHDGEAAIQQLPNHTSSVSCPASDGYIMSYSWRGDNKYRFSNCCQQNIRNLVNQQPRWHCLIEVKIKKTISNNKDLPGMRTTQEHFCQKTYLFDYDASYDKTYGVKDCKGFGAKIRPTGSRSALSTARLAKRIQHCILGKCIEINKQ